MTVEAALAERFKPLRARLRLPNRVPPFNTTAHHVFTIIWIAALLLAVGGALMGLYNRYSSPGANSQLLLGSRAGFAVSPQDATQIRFTVGHEAREAGIKTGDHIIAIYGLPLPAKMPVTEQSLTTHADDPAYIAMGNLLFGTEELPFPLTVKSRDGSVHEVTVVTSEDHINNAARDIGVSPTLLSFIDLVHVIFYPFLVWAAWILHRRNSRDAVSSVLSLAILLMIGSELPSYAFLSSIGVPHQVLTGMYDVGNVLLIAGILLFPHGDLTPRLAILLALSPVLMFLHGQLYQAYFLMLLIIAVLIQIRCLRTAQSSDLKQQIKWALFGFSGYAVFRALYISADFLKWSVENFATQIGLEVAAGLALGVSILVLQLGLLVALIRYRLYDADSIISRTASVAILTFGIGGTFAAVMEGIITGAQFLYPESDTSQTLAAMAGAVVAAVFLEPMNRHTHDWVEKHFHKSILEIREELPELMRDTRDSASLDEFLHDVLSRIVTNLLAVRGAVILEREVRQTIAISQAEVLRWFVSQKLIDDRHVLDCVPEDKLFPVRLEVETSTGAFGWVLIGPRPDGSIAGKDEQKAVRNISSILGRSIRIVLTREQEKQEMHRLLDAHGQRIERIERLLKLRT